MTAVAREERQTLTVGDVTVTIFVRTEIRDLEDDRGFVITARKEAYAVLVERDGIEPVVIRL